jgi:hypothetical protein
MTYGLGRRLEYFDMPTVRKIVHSAAANNYRFSSLVMGIVSSDAFRLKKVTDGDKSAEPLQTAELKK